VSEVKVITKALIKRLDEITPGCDLKTASFVTDGGPVLNAAMASIGKTNADAANTRTTADAAAYAKVKDAEADAVGDLARQKADIEADAYRADKLNIDGAEVFRVTELGKIIRKSDKFFIPGGFEGLMAMFMANLGKSASKEQPEKEMEDA
jgi:hypothetical protein